MSSVPRGLVERGTQGSQFEGRFRHGYCHLFLLCSSMA
jgi:hypothetical protein